MKCSRFLIPLILLLSSESLHGARPDPTKSSGETFSATKQALEAARIRIPESRDCGEENLTRTYSRFHQRQMGTCGALDTLWKEAQYVQVTVFNARFDPLDAIDADSSANNCQSERRIRLFQTALDSLESVDRRVQAEGKRIEDLCKQDRKQFQDYRQAARQHCVQMMGMQRAESKAREVEQDIDKLVKKAEKPKKWYSDETRSNRIAFSRGIAQAKACGNSLNSIPKRPQR